MLQEIGKIIKPKNVTIFPHELRVAEILALTGFDVKFIPPRNIKTPDIRFKKLNWEIKSPKGKSSRTLENNMRAALKQSNNIIIDLGRIQLPEHKCINTIEQRAKKLGKRYKVMIITRAGEVIKLY